MTNLYQYEETFHEKGYNLIAGTDEVGRGPLAGPVVAAAVILPKEIIVGINDSKKLSSKKRESLNQEILNKAIAYEIVFIDNYEIDKINIYQASKKAMIKAIQGLKMKPDFILSDAMPLDLDIPSLAIIKGDTLSASIGAASIIAKVARDKYMLGLHEKYPMYGFDTNFGYPTKKHLKAIEEYGITPYHRLSYKPNQNTKQMRLEI